MASCTALESVADQGMLLDWVTACWHVKHLFQSRMTLSLDLAALPATKQGNANVLKLLA